MPSIDFTKVPAAELPRVAGNIHDNAQQNLDEYKTGLAGDIEDLHAIIRVLAERAQQATLTPDAQQRAVTALGDKVIDLNERLIDASVITDQVLAESMTANQTVIESLQSTIAAEQLRTRLMIERLNHQEATILYLAAELAKANKKETPQ